AGRRLGSSSLTQDDTDDATASLFSDKAELRNAEEWLLRLDYSASKPSPIQQQQSQRLSQVTHSWSTCCRRWRRSASQAPARPTRRHGSSAGRLTAGFPCAGSATAIRPSSPGLPT